MRRNACFDRCAEYIGELEGRELREPLRHEDLQRADGLVEAHGREGPEEGRGARAVELRRGLLRPPVRQESTLSPERDFEGREFAGVSPSIFTEFCTSLNEEIELKLRVGPYGFAWVSVGSSWSAWVRAKVKDSVP